jgi:predicted DNA-binding protein
MPPKENRRTFRLSDEEYNKLKQQAEKVGQDATGYIKLIIALDTATEIIKRLGGKGK